MKRPCDPKILPELLEYDEYSGVLKWKVRDVKFFKGNDRHGPEMFCKAWNTKNAGKLALNSDSFHGYKRGRLFDVGVFAHRVIWALYYGKWPTDCIDHINGNPQDNRISNLRDVPHKINMQNHKRRKDNKSGWTGVGVFRKKWYAGITHNDIEYHLGYFDTKEDAIAARIAANRKYGFHPNHGRFVA